MTWENVGFMLLGASLTALAVVSGLLVYFWKTRQDD